ncbi:MAG: hypothetical protein Q9209_004127 [Squamulea sp. 1 TL-2023]
MVSERFAIAVAEIVVYSVLLPIALVVTVRHGMSGSVGFLYLCIFCCLRISAAGLSIASEHDGRTNCSHLVWSEILGSIGIGPLLLMGFSLITRVNRNSNPRSTLRTNTIRMLYIPNVLALNLAIVGGVRLSSRNLSQQRSGKQFAQTGLSIFMVVFAIYTVICFLTLFKIDTVVPGERRILYGVLLAIPFIFLRIFYAVLTVFKDSKKFAIVNGSATVQFCMAIIEEMVVVVIYCGIGLFAPTENEIEKRKTDQRLQRAAMRGS